MSLFTQSEMIYCRRNLLVGVGVSVKGKNKTTMRSLGFSLSEANANKSCVNGVEQNLARENFHKRWKGIPSPGHKGPLPHASMNWKKFINFILCRASHFQFILNQHKLPFFQLKEHEKSSMLFRYESGSVVFYAHCQQMTISASTLLGRTRRLNTLMPETRPLCWLMEQQGNRVMHPARFCG